MSRTYQIAFQLGASVSSSMRQAFNTANQNVNNLNNNTNNLNRSSGGLTDTFNRMRGPAVAAGVAIASIATSMYATVTASDQFKQSMQLVAAKTDESTVNMAEIAKISKNLYTKNLGEDWMDVANAISTVQSVTKLSGAALENTTKSAILYRDIFGEDITQSVKATDTMMKNFGITADQAYNLLVQGAQKGLNKSGELIDSANEYAPYFKSLGFSANQMFDTFSAGLSSGAFNLDKVADAVKEFNIRSKDGSKASSEAFAELNMDANKMSQTFAKGGPEAQKAFIKVVQAISAIKDPVKKNAVGVALMGTQFEDLEADVVAAMGTVQQQFDMTKDSMESLEAVKYDNLTGAFKGIWRSIQTYLLLPIGDKLLPTVQKIADNVRIHIPTVQKAFGAIGNRVSSTVSTFKQFGSSVVTAVAPIAKTIGGIVMPIIADAANFFTNIVVQIKDFWNSNGAEIMQATKNVFSFISNVIQTISPVIFFIVKTVWNNIKGAIQGAVTVILSVIKIFSSLFTGNWSGLWNGVVDLVKGALQLVWNVWNLMMMGRLVKGVAAIVKSVVGFFKGLGTQLSTNVQYYYHLFRDGFYRIGNGILRAIGNAIMGVISIARNGITNFITIFQTARTFGVNIFMSLVSAVRGMFVSIFGAIRATVGTVISAVVTRISSFVTSVSGFMTNLWTTIVTIFNNIKLAMMTPFQSVKTVIVTVVTTIKSTVQGLFSTVKAAGTGAINSLISAANAMIGGINSLNVDIPDWVPKVGGKSIGFNIPKIPMLAKGGITTGPTLAMIGEGAEQEAVLPLSKLQGLLNGNSKTTNHEQQQIIYSPHFIVQGNADSKTIDSVAKQGYEQFKNWYEDINRNNDRLSFKRN